MSVKKIFGLLITVVACVIIGALVLNVLVPNAATAIVNAVEGMIYNATSLEFDFNGDGYKEAQQGRSIENAGQDSQGTAAYDGASVDGWGNNTSGGAGGGGTP